MVKSTQTIADELFEKRMTILWGWSLNALFWLQKKTYF